MIRRALGLVMAGVGVLAVTGCAGPVPPVPLVHAHAHNDYEHARPLQEALERGFCSVEADVHLIEGRLLVAHDREQAEKEFGNPKKTLQTMYLEPLRKRAATEGGRIYRSGPTVVLLIDIKTKPPGPAYQVIKDVLGRYRSMLTTWGPEGKRERAVTVIITGEHTHEMIARDAVRWCASDGTLADLGRRDLSPEVCPWISSEWGKTFKRDGKGEMPEGEREKLRRLVAEAHEEGRKIRFWGAPDNRRAWEELRAAGVDLINTDDLAGAQQFLLHADPGPGAVARGANR